MRSFVLSTAATAIAFALVTWLIPQYISYNGDLVGLLGLAVVFGVVNGLVKPIVRLLAIPLRVMTLGLIGFVINAAMLLLTWWATARQDFDCPTRPPCGSPARSESPRATGRNAATMPEPPSSAVTSTSTVPIDSSALTCPLRRIPAHRWPIMSSRTSST